MASTGDLRGEMTGMRGRKASMGAIMSEFVQQQQGLAAAAEEEHVNVFMSVRHTLPDVKSPVPQKVSSISQPHPKPMRRATREGLVSYDSQSADQTI